MKPLLVLGMPLLWLSVACVPKTPVVVPLQTTALETHIVVKGVDGRDVEHITGRLVRFDSQPDVVCVPMSSVMLTCAVPSDLDYGALFTGHFGGDGYGELVEVITAAPDVNIAGLPLLDPPLMDKTALIHGFQGNFNFKLPNCDLHLDNAFDPYGLWMWINRPDCFRQWLDAHAQRGDNVVAVDPRSGYHGYQDVDIWHDPSRFAAFLREIRQTTNVRGESLRALVVFGADGHIDDMTAPGALDHWKQDVSALAAVARDWIDVTVPCWECRHRGGSEGLGFAEVSAATYYEMAAWLVQQFPQAVHGIHLIENSSSPSSWPCADCVPPADAADPAHGNEIEGWTYMLSRGIADVFLFQVLSGDPYVRMDAYPPGQGSIERVIEVCVRLCDDPVAEQTRAQMNENRHGWPAVPVLWWEFVYDYYWNKGPDDAMQVRRCQQFLDVGGWGCGSASYRRP